MQVTGELISLGCPEPLRRLQQPCRARRCTHAAAFCSTALAALRIPGGEQRSYRCPICSTPFVQVQQLPAAPRRMVARRRRAL